MNSPHLIGLDEDDERLFEFGRVALVQPWSHYLGLDMLRSPEGRSPGLHMRATDVTEFFADWQLGRDDCDFPEFSESAFKALSHELGTATFGWQGELYADNTVGKTEAVARYRKNSSEASLDNANEIIELIKLGAHESLGWIGAVLAIGRVQLKNSTWRFRAIIVACSGVQGMFDQLFSATAAYAMIAGWGLALKADDEAGNPHLVAEPTGTVRA